MLVRLEMDKERMSSFLQYLSTNGAMLLRLGFFLCVGIALGIVYFKTMVWNVRLFLRGGRAKAAAAVLFGRLAVLGACLTAISLQGATYLLAAGLGVMIGRGAVLRKVKVDAP